MAWILLFVAGVLEVVWAYTMKLSAGFTRLISSAITLSTVALSFGLLALAMRTLPPGTAYNAWTGAGAIGAFVIGIAVLREPLTAARCLAAALILAGLVLMKLSSVD